MTKRQLQTTWEPPIDQSYEQQVTALDRVDGHVSDYAGSYEIEPIRQQMPATWTPAQTPQQAHNAQRSATIGHLRQMVDQQGREPQRVDTGNRFVITDDSDARTRAGAGIAWWLVTVVSLIPLGLGIAVWIFAGWGVIAFTLTFIGAGMVIGAAILNWQSIAQSPIAIERKQRALDHEYRMYREENAQRTREMIVGGFMGNVNAKRDQPPINGLLVDSRNEVR